MRSTQIFIPFKHIFSLVFLLIVSVILGKFALPLIQPKTVNAQAGQARMRLMTWNTEADMLRAIYGSDYEGGHKGYECPPLWLRYHIDKTVYIAQVAKSKNLDVISLQEMQAHCEAVKLTTDAMGRDVVDWNYSGNNKLMDGPKTKEQMEWFKKWFKDNYNNEGRQGRSMTDAQFEEELISVMGKSVYEDVWVQFLPFDSTFWVAANLAFTQNYPMQITTKPYVRDRTQWFRVSIASKYPYTKVPNLNDNGTMPYMYDREIYPLPRRDDEEEVEDIASGTRWIVIAPLNTPFGEVFASALHPRAGIEAKPGVSRINYQSDQRWGVDNASGPLYMLGGDFNQEINRTGSDHYNMSGKYALGGAGIDWWAIPKSRDARMRFDQASHEVLVANGSGRAEGVPPSDHNAHIIDVVGPQVNNPPPLTEITLPDYLPHNSEKDEDKPKSPPVAAPPTGEQCSGGFLEDFHAIRNKPEVLGMLLFSPFGDNPDPEFQKHAIPPGYISQLCGGATCVGSKVGINPGNRYGQGGKERPAQHGFDWFLQIADAAKPQDVAEAINVLPANTQAVIRIGIAGDGIGFGTDPGQYTAFLGAVWGMLSEEKKATTWAIAGPNEVDIEWNWFAPDCAPGHGSAPNDAASTTFYACVGPKLSSYMNAVIDGNPGFKLLSPAFNMTSYTLQGIFNAMDTSGANWAGLTAISGNLYPLGTSMMTHWQTNGIDALLAKAGKPLVITETGVGELSCDITSEISRDNYYITPIKGVGTSNNRSEMLGDMISQGYRAACLGRGFQVGVTAEGLEHMGILFAQEAVSEPPDTKYQAVLGGLGMGLDRAYLTDKIYSVLTADYRDTLYPIYRDIGGPGNANKESLEAYFGHQVTSNAATYSSAEIESAAINSLVTNPQRCGLSYLNLISRDAMCKKLADPNACALYATNIPNTSYNARDLLAAFNGYSAHIKEQKANPNMSLMEVCKALMGSNESEYNFLKRGMRNAPLEMEEAYRLAFAVTSIKLRLPNPDTYTNLFAHPYGGWLAPPMPKHGVVITAFKIPDILTNKGSIDDGLMAERGETGIPNYVNVLQENKGTSGHTYWLDPAVMTRNSLIPNDDAYVYERQQRCQREVFRQAAALIANRSQYDNWAEIACVAGGGDSGGGIGVPACKDPLGRALVDLINTQAILDPMTANVGDYCALDPVAIAQQVMNSKPGEVPPVTGDPPAEGAELNQGQLDMLAQITSSEVEEDGDFVCFNNYETADYINDPAQLEPLGASGHVFNEQWGLAFLEKLFESDNCSHLANGPGYATSGTLEDCPDTEDYFLKSKFYLLPDKNAGTNTGNPLQVKQFVVYPTGYDLRTVEAVLAGSFFSTQQLTDLLKASLTYDRIELQPTEVKFTGGSDQFSFTEARMPPLETTCEPVEKTRTYYDPLAGIDRTETYTEWECPTYTIGFRMQQLAANKPNAILGGRLGFWMRTVQRSLVSTSMKTWEYLKTCRSTEEFLLDVCGREPKEEDWGPLPQPPDPPALPVPPPGENIWVYGADNQDTSLSGIATNLENTSEVHQLLFQRALIHDDMYFDTRVVRLATRVNTQFTIKIPWEVDPNFAVVMTPTGSLPIKLNGNEVSFEIPAKDPTASAYVLKTHNKRNPNQTIVFFVDDYNEVPQDEIPIPGAVSFDPNNEGAIQGMIDAATPGSKFYFPAGSYEISSFNVKDKENIHFIMNPNATITMQKPTGQPSSVPIIHILNSNNISWQGPGYIFSPERVDNNGIVVRDSSNISLNDFYMYRLKDKENGPLAQEHSNIVALNDVRVISENGGLDPVNGSTNITFNRVYVESTDDAVAMKTRQDADPTIGFRLYYSFTKSSSSAMKVGQDSIRARVDDILFENSTAYDSDRSLIVTAGNGHGTVGNVLYKNIRVRFIKSSGYHHAIQLSEKPDAKRNRDMFEGSNIVFENIYAEQAGPNEVSKGHATVRNSTFLVDHKDENVFRPEDCSRLTLIGNVVKLKDGQPGGHLGCDQEEGPQLPTEGICQQEGGIWVVIPEKKEEALASMRYTDKTSLADVGVATYYGKGVMNTVMRTRLNASWSYMRGNTQLVNCELSPAQMNYGATNPNPLLEDGTKFIGCVAMLRAGDLTFNASRDPNDVRRIWIKKENTSAEPVGPFAVIDVARDVHAPCLDNGQAQGRHWVVDINYDAFANLFKQTAGPDNAIICESKDNCSAAALPNPVGGGGTTPSTATTCSGRAKTGNEVNITTYNLGRAFSSAREPWTALANMAKTTNTDVFALQEVSINAKTGQQQLIAEEFTKVFGSAWHLDYIAHDGDSATDGYGNAVLSRYPIKRLDTFLVESERTGDPRAPRRYGKYEVQTPGGNVILYNIHTRADEPCHGVRKARDFMMSTSSSGQPVVVAGDFNAGYDSVAGGGDCNASTNMGRQCVEGAPVCQSPWIDHVVVRNDGSARLSEACGRNNADFGGPSQDHHPVSATVRF